MKQIALVGLVALLALAPWGMGMTSNVAAAGPTAVATTSSNLVDEQWVKVVLSGFKPGDFVRAVQCKPSPVHLSTDCTHPQPGFFPGTIMQPLTQVDSTGSDSFLMPVFAGSDETTPNTILRGSKDNATTTVNQGSNSYITDVPCDSSHPCFPCDFTRSCVIAVLSSTLCNCGGNLSGTDDYSNAVLVPISFARTTDSCPPKSGKGILGSGSESAFLATLTWQSAACLRPYNQSVQYAAASSESGASDFFRNAGNGFAPPGNQFAFTGPIPARGPADPGVTAPPGVTYAYAPVAASAVVLGYRIYDAVTGNPVTNLTLSVDDVARIFGQGGDLNYGSSWNLSRVSDISSLNPGVHFPSTNFKLFALAEHSEQTLVFSTWMSQQSPSWKSEYCPATTATCSDVIDTMPVAPLSNVGGDGLLTGWKKEGFGLASFSVSDTSTRAGAIGIMDSSAAQFYGLPTANIKLNNGTIVSATPDSIAHALADSKLNADNTLTPASANDYPMLMPTYMMVPTNTIAPDQGAAVASFLRYAVSDGQHILPPGYVPLPQNVVERSLDVADKIPQITATPNPGSGNGSGVGSALAGVSSGLLNGLGLSSQSLATNPAKTNTAPAAKAPASSSPQKLTLPANQGAELWLVARLTSSGAVWLLPVLVVLGVASLVLGPGIEASFRWRRQIGGVFRRLLFFL